MAAFNSQTSQSQTEIKAVAVVSACSRGAAWLGRQDENFPVPIQQQGNSSLPLSVQVIMAWCLYQSLLCWIFSKTCPSFANLMDADWTLHLPHALHSSPHYPIKPPFSGNGTMSPKGKNSADMGFTLLSGQDTVMGFTNTPRAQGQSWIFLWAMFTT